MTSTPVLDDGSEDRRVTPLCLQEIPKGCPTTGFLTDPSPSNDDFLGPVSVDEIVATRTKRGDIFTTLSGLM